MVSTKLKSLAAHFAAWAGNPAGVHLDQRVLLLLEGELADAASQASMIEGLPAGPLSGGHKLRLVHSQAAPAVAPAGHALGGAA